MLNEANCKRENIKETHCTTNSNNTIMVINTMLYKCNTSLTIQILLLSLSVDVHWMYIQNTIKFYMHKN